MSQARRDAGIRQLTERDRETLTEIAEGFTFCFTQVQQVLGLSPKAETKTPGLVAPSTARNAITRWLAMELIELPRKIIAEHPPYIWLSRTGLTQLGLTLPYYQPKPATIYHIYAVNAVRLHLQQCHLQAEWRAQRLLAKTTEVRPLPDAELHTRGVPIIAIRVIERITNPLFIRDELKSLIALTERYPRLWYFLHPGVTLAMQEILSSLDQETRRKIITYNYGETMQEIILPTAFHQRESTATVFSAP